jgi:hypothetical protein
MNKLITLLTIIALTSIAQAALKPGDSLSAYEIKNVETGKQYCQVCAYGAKAGKIIAFGKLNDESFWADLKKLQALQNQNSKLGVFAQVIDSKDSDAIKAAAKKNGITFPVVVAVKRDWDDAYKVHGVSRTIYFAQQDNKIVWTSVGLNEESATELQTKVKKHLAS